MVHSSSADVTRSLRGCCREIEVENDTKLKYGRPRGLFETNVESKRVTPAEELGTMSKNNLRGITLGIRRI